ncbi:MAG: pilus assembly protein N-terminal domain-containing protein [Hyphomonadaceae bacterium]|nr:pilus assembly protein N-terminal domain-containing protein [Hyphomonadaceae bacterium]
MMMRGLATVLAAVVVSGALAFGAMAGEARAGEVQVALDQSRSIALPASASGVVIGNPTVAGVSVQNDRLLFVTGRSYGSTNLIVVGRNGRPIFETRVTVIPDESNVVMVTRGAYTQRFDCSPLCRRRPDLSDDPESFSQANEKIAARAGQAAGQ